MDYRNDKFQIGDIVRYLKSISRDFNDRIAPLVEYYAQHGTIGDIQISDNFSTKIVILFAYFVFLLYFCARKENTKHFY